MRETPVGTRQVQLTFTKTFIVRADQDTDWIRSTYKASYGMDVVDETPLQNALRAAIGEIREHNSEYHHTTPEDRLKEWEKLL